MMDRGEIAGGRVGVWVSLGRVRDGLVAGWLCCERSDEDRKENEMEGWLLCDSKQRMIEVNKDGRVVRR